jgi:hypothetical protein
LTGPRVLCLRQEVAIPGWIRGILRLLRVDQILRLEGPFEPFKIALEGTAPASAESAPSPATISQVCSTPPCTRFRLATNP